MSAVVFIHEGGHFLAARMFHVRVSEFMIGLPGPSIGFVHNGCRYGLTAIPLGGYARIAGMETTPEDPLMKDALAYVYRHGYVTIQTLAFGLNIDEDEAESLIMTLSSWASITTPKGKFTGDLYLAPESGDYAKGQPRPVDDPEALLDEQRKGTYHGLPCWKRLVCLFAGPLFNILTAIIIVVILLSAHGVYEPTNTLSGIVDGSPAASAGLQAGDVITGIDGNGVDDWTALSDAVSSKSPGDTIDITYERDAQSAETNVTLYDNEGKTAIGIYSDTKLVHLNVIQSLSESGNYIMQVMNAIGQLFNPSTMKQTLDQSTSIVGIAYETKAAADQGLLSLLSIAIAISVSLGIMNLLPIPPLDGGKIVIELIQKLVRHQLPERANLYLSFAGIAFFMLLFVYLTFQDIGKYIVGG